MEDKIKLASLFYCLGFGSCALIYMVTDWIHDKSERNYMNNNIYYLKLRIKQLVEEQEELTEETEFNNKKKEELKELQNKLEERVNKLQEKKEEEIRKIK